MPSKPPPNHSVFEPVIAALLEQMAEGGPLRAEGGSFPAGHYADPDHLALEQATLFRTWPQATALSCDLPEIGSQITRDRLGLPVVLVRADDGSVHALANVCAHRGAQVVDDGRHCSRRMSCPYHGWSYDLEGTLVGVPDAASFPDLVLPRPGMTPLPVVEQGGLIWVTPDLEAATEASPGLGTLADELSAYEPGNHEHWRHHRFDLELNWKLVIDTFLEGYHFASLHRNTVGPLFVPNLCAAERIGPHVREVLPRRTFTELRDVPAEARDLIPHTALVYVLFPNTVFVVQIDHLETWRVYPDPADPGRSVCDLDFYLPELPATDSALRHWEANWKITIDTVIDEDFSAMAGVQRGLASGAIDQITVGQNEPALALFHHALADAHSP